MDDPSPVLGTFVIADEDDGPQSGVITNFIDQYGNEAQSPHHAECWVGLVTQGSWAGKWVNCPVDETDEWTHYKVH